MPRPSGTDPVAKTAKVEILDDVTIEFPTINLSHAGIQNRHSYVVGFPGTGLETFAIVKYDGRTGQRSLLQRPPNVMPGEPCLVPDPQGRGRPWPVADLCERRRQQRGPIVDPRRDRPRQAAGGDGRETPLGPRQGARLLDRRQGNPRLTSSGRTRCGRGEDSRLPKIGGGAAFTLLGP